MKFDGAIITGVKSDHVKRLRRISFEIEMDDGETIADSLAEYAKRGISFKITLEPNQTMLFTLEKVGSGSLRANSSTGEIVEDDE